MLPGFVIEQSHYERRRGWRGWIDFALRRRPVQVIDKVRLV